MSDQQDLCDVLFHLTMRKKWVEVVELYKKKTEVHAIMLTESKDTAFHIAISSYNTKSSNPIHERCTKEMLSLMIENWSFSYVLTMPNARGDTPLHLAAAVGWDAICILIAEQDRELISIRNVYGETPLFVAAHCGNLYAFRSLHRIHNDEKDMPDESLCRRKDGNTVLHSAISGEYLRLAYLIIHYYKNLLNSVNVDGETPLHFLARKPNLFKSCAHLGFYESIIYRCVIVDDDLKKLPIHNPRPIQDGSSPGKLPENYKTCVSIFHLLWNPIYKDYKGSRINKQNRQCVEHGIPINESFLAGCCSTSKKQTATPTNENGENQSKGAYESKDYGSYPPNYTTCISILKLPIKYIQMLGIGFKRTKIHEKKVRHSHAMEMMNKMIEFEPSYKYDSTGQRPVLKYSEAFNIPDSEEINIPDSPPDNEEHDTSQIPEAYLRTTSSVKDQQKHDKNQPAEEIRKESPLLVAAKTGILEIVKKILDAVPGAIEDKDSRGRNVLMVAAQNRQISVFNFLLETNIPDYVFHHVDNDGNSILHLAAKLVGKQPWRIPGPALQMQWEILWYKHVKRSIPSRGFTLHNATGETPREIFTRTHEDMVKTGNEWLIKTSESCSVVAALIATVAFATSATVPGGLDQMHGHPILSDHKAFDIFSIASPIALCLSITALFYFLTIIAWRFEERDFKRDLPKKLLMGLTCLFCSIAAMLLSFVAGHTFVLTRKLRSAAMPIYAAAMIPVMIFAIGQLPMYCDLVWAAHVQVPLRNYKVFTH